MNHKKWRKFAKSKFILELNKTNESILSYTDKIYLYFKKKFQIKMHNIFFMFFFIVLFLSKSYSKKTINQLKKLNMLMR